nr:MBL fold metallo-hydrolase [uncultured Cetobacterium sp.]
MVENKTSNKELSKEHGLSLYIETNGKKILFDVGESKKFLKNAKKMGIDISDIDCLILSHGHKDHAGGLPYFLEENKKARIYCSDRFFDRHYKKILGAYLDIGLPYEYMDVERFIFVDKEIEIGNLLIFHCEDCQNSNPLNDSLYRKNEEDEYEKDNFSHEINLVIRESDGDKLITGCAHKGIGNIIRRARELSRDIKTIVGGLHLSSRSSLNKNDQYIDKIVKKINKTIVEEIYTCHCTGEHGVKRLQEESNAHVVEIMTGDKYCI